MSLQVTDRVPVDAVPMTSPEFPLTALHRQCCDQFLLDVVRRAVVALQRQSDDLAAVVERLQDAGVDALDGHYADLCRAATKGREQALWNLLQVTRQLGGRTSAGLSSSLQDIHSGPLALLTAAAVDPDDHSTVAICLDDAFRSLRRDQREAILSYLTHLARSLDVVVVATAVGRRFLAHQHHDALPGGVLATCSPGQGPVPDDAETAAADAIAALGPDSTAIDLFERVVAESGPVPYDEFTAETDLARSTIRSHVATLTDHELLTRVSLSGRAAVVPGPLADPAVSAVQEHNQAQAALSDFSAEADVEGTTGSSGTTTGTSGPDSTSVHDPPKSSYESRDPSRARDGGQEGTRDDTVPQWTGGHQTSYLPPADHAAAVGASAAGEVVLVDRPLEHRSDRGEPWVSVAPDGSEVVASTEWINPLQGTVCLALALLSEDVLELLSRRASESRLSRLLADESRARNARTLGFVEDGTDVDRLLNRLRWAREDLKTISGEARSDEPTIDPDDLRSLTLQDHSLKRLDREQARSVVASVAAGLAAEAAHLLDLVDVEVVRELRLPQASRHLDEDDCRALAQSIGHQSLTAGAYGDFTVYRQTHEDRDRHRDVALEPTVDAADPFGSPIGSWVVVGDGLDDVEIALYRHLEPTDPHPESPEIGLPLSIATPDRRSFALALRRTLRKRRLLLTREAAAIIRGLVADPYAASRAVANLGEESSLRRLRLSEVRYALSRLPATAILREATPTMRELVHGLLNQSGPVSRRSLAEEIDRSTQSIRNNLDPLVGADLVRETDEGLRLALPMRSDQERWQEQGDQSTVPRGLVEDLYQPRDVVDDLAVELGVDSGRLTDPDDPVGAAVTWLARDEPPDLTSPRSEWSWYRAIERWCRWISQPDLWGELVEEDPVKAIASGGGLHPRRQSVPTLEAVVDSDGDDQPTDPDHLLGPELPQRPLATAPTTAAGGD